MSTLSCTVDGCSTDVKRLGLCYAHYMKNWRYGTPTPQHDVKWMDLAGQRFDLLTVVERRGSKWYCTCECGGSREVLAGDLNRTGRKSCGDRSKHPTRRPPETLTYRGSHDRMRHLSGSAKLHTCMDCGKPAQQWSYNHKDPHELLEYGLSAGLLPYSLDHTYYEPRCISCHKLFDLARFKD